MMLGANAPETAPYPPMMGIIIRTAMAATRTETAAVLTMVETAVARTNRQSDYSQPSTINPQLTVVVLGWTTISAPLIVLL